jgi:antitoxin MazE
MSNSLAVEIGRYNVISLGGYSVKTRLIAIGNSRGVRLPKPLIEEAGLEEDVEIHARKGEIVIRPVQRPRAGWAGAAGDLRSPACRFPRY